MRALIAPAVALMNRLKYPQKFVLIALLLVLPLGWVLNQYVGIANERIAFSAKERVGIEYLEPVSSMLQSMQMHMALSAAVRQDSSYRDELDALAVQIDEQVAAVDSVDRRIGEELGVTESWEEIKSDWAFLDRNLSVLAESEIVVWHIRLIDKMQALIIQVGNNSNLILDPDLDTYYLMDTVIVQIPRATTYYSQLRNDLLDAAYNQSIDTSDLSRLVVYSGLSESVIDLNQQGLAYAFEYNPALATRLADAQTASPAALSPFNEQVAALIDSEDPTGLNPTVVLDTATEGIDAQFALYDAALTELDSLIASRISAFEMQRTIAISVAVVALLLTIYLMIGFYRSVVRVIRSLDRAVIRMVESDTHTELVLDNRDELAEVANQFNRIAGELVTARDTAVDASRAKSTFLANMSHELRTPLNAIIGYSELLIEDSEMDGNKHQLGDLNKIRNAGKHLLGLINDILDMSKIEAGKMELYMESFDVSTMLTEVVNTVQKLAEKNGNTLDVHVAPEIGMMEADITKIRQSLFNLLSNASKFTEKGTVTLRATRQSTAPEGAKPPLGYVGDWVIFSVQDTGIGMDADQRARVFREFEQADASTTRKYGGTGLGLAITQNFVRMMGGDIGIESEPGVGSTFTIWLPADLNEPRIITEGDLPSNASTVLVIDDDPAVREMMQRFLMKEGFRVELARGGQEGLARARELRPAVITLDVMMPHMDGWAVLSALKADPLLNAIPVIMVTIVEQKEMGYMLGASDYITKPVDRSRLADALNKYRCGDRPCQVLIVEDDDATREMMRRMLEEQGWVVNEAANGRIGLDAVKQTRPEVVLLDLMMPEVDGFQFIAELRQNPDPLLASLPVIVVTARDLSAQERKSLSGNVEKIIQKGGNSRTTNTVLSEIRDMVSAHVKETTPEN